MGWTGDLCAEAVISRLVEAHTLEFDQIEYIRI